MVEEVPDVKPTSKYSISKTAELLGVDRSTIHRWIKQKKIKREYRQATESPVITGLEIIKCWNKTY